MFNPSKIPRLYRFVHFNSSSIQKLETFEIEKNYLQLWFVHSFGRRT